METLTLRIKKVFFDQILDGSKTKEYRSDTEYYRSLFAKKPKRLKLHYQGGKSILADIRGIRRINKPKRLQNSPYVTTEKVFVISLSDPKLI